MRAYMSGTGGGSGGHPDFANAAVVEARRILAETEPALGRIGVMDAAWHGHAVTMRGTEDGMALAEALAAFVAD